MVLGMRPKNLSAGVLPSCADEQGVVQKLNRNSWILSLISPSSLNLIKHLLESVQLGHWLEDGRVEKIYALFQVTYTIF